MEKTKVYKMCGTWVWECNDHLLPIASQAFTNKDYRDPWSVCLFDATRHSDRFHDHWWQDPEEI